MFEFLLIMTIIYSCEGGQSALGGNHIQPNTVRPTASIRPSHEWELMTGGSCDECPTSFSSDDGDMCIQYSAAIDCLNTCSGKNSVIKSIQKQYNKKCSMTGGSFQMTGGSCDECPTSFSSSNGDMCIQYSAAIDCFNTCSGENSGIKDMIQEQYDLICSGECSVNEIEKCINEAQRIGSTCRGLEAAMECYEDCTHMGLGNTQAAVEVQNTYDTMCKKTSKNCDDAMSCVMTAFMTGNICGTKTCAEGCSGGQIDQIKSQMAAMWIYC